MQNKTLSIIVPTYNEENYIKEVIARIVDSDTGNYKKEIIIVDDGSTDKTVFSIKYSVSSIKKSNKIIIKTIFKKQNEGKGAALKAGILKSTGDIVLIQDSDLEYNPKDYPTLLEPFLQFDADVVFGSRFVSNKPRRILYFWHHVANIVLTTFSNMLSNLNLTDMETGYKVFQGEVIRKIAIQLQSKQFGFEPEVVARIAKIKNLKIFEVGISYQGRTYDEGKKIKFIDAVKALFEIIKYNLF